MIRLRILGYKGYYILKGILDYSFLISDIIIGTDKDVLNDFSKEIKNLCEQNNILFYYNSKEPQSTANYTIAIGWRWLIEDEKIIVFHDSLLPRYRGFNPLVTALINGDNNIGVTALWGTKDYDTGDIIGQYALSISYPIKINTAIEKLAVLYLKLLYEILEKIKNNIPIIGIPQNKSKITYSIWRNREDYFIDWSKDAPYICRMIDAVGYPYEGAKTRINELELTILDAEEVPDVIIENRCLGKVIFKDESSLTIICGQGLIKVKTFYTKNKESFNYKKLFRLKFW